jgi:ribose transport system substrate-binding protein
MRHRTLWISALGLAAVTLAASACGSSSAGSSATSSSSGSTSSALAQAAANTTKYEGANGYGAFESEQLGPVTPPKNLSIVFVSAEAAAAGVAVDAAGLEQAAALVGYKVTVCSGGGTVTGTQGCFESAIQQHPTAIINQAFDPSFISEQIANARKAGILVIGQFDAQTTTRYENGLVGGAVCAQQGQILGDAIAAKSAGKAHVLLYNDPSISCLGQRNDGVEKALATLCPSSCSTKTFAIQVADASAIPGIIHSSLTANPNTNWIVGPTDFISLDADNEVRQSGDVGKVFVAGLDGDAPNLIAMRSGGAQSIQQLDVVAADTMLGYLDVDLIMRLKDNSKVPLDTLYPTNKIFTPSNIPAGPDPGYHGPAGFEQEYKTLWGVK